MIKRENWNNSLRGEFAYRLYSEIVTVEGDDIWLLVGDLGYGVFDIHKNYLNKGGRFINCGASEQAMLDIAVGLAQEGKIPVVYSITPFLIYRGFETIRTYINHEKIPVKLIGSGRDDDYKHDGFSHNASDVDLFMDGKRGIFHNIENYWPDTNEELSTQLSDMLYNGKPSFMSLRR